MPVLMQWRRRGKRSVLLLTTPSLPPNLPLSSYRAHSTNNNKWKMEILSSPTHSPPLAPRPGQLKGGEFPPPRRVYSLPKSAEEDPTAWVRKSPPPICIAGGGGGRAIKIRDSASFSPLLVPERSLRGQNWTRFSGSMGQFRTVFVSLVRILSHPCQRRIKLLQLQSSPNRQLNGRSIHSHSERI